MPGFDEGLNQYFTSWGDESAVSRRMFVGEPGRILSRRSRCRLDERSQRLSSHATIDAELSPERSHLRRDDLRLSPRRCCAAWKTTWAPSGCEKPCVTTPSDIVSKPAAARTSWPPSARARAKTGWFWNQAVYSTRVADYEVMSIENLKHELAFGLWDCPPRAATLPDEIEVPENERAEWLRKISESNEAACQGKPAGRQELSPPSEKTKKAAAKSKKRSSSTER